MNSNWKLRVAFCLIAFVYVIGINCVKTDNDKGSDGIKFTFNISNKIGEPNDLKNESQIDCTPTDLCDKIKFKVVTCTGELFKPQF